MKPKKIKRATKKVGKKKTTKKKTTRKTSTELRIVVTQPTAKDLEPIKNKSKYSLVTTGLENKQILHMLQKTPPVHIQKRAGKGGGTFDYVTGIYMKKVLNYIFGWDWDFEIIEHGTEGKYVWVKGKLTVRIKGKAIVKMQFGGADIKYKKGTQIMLDYGNDLKAAATDALKKCASELGIASDVYGGNEFKDIGTPVEDEVTEKVVIQTEAIEDFTCHGIGKNGCSYNPDLTKAEHDYSIKLYKKPLCRDCQKEVKSKK